MAIDAQHPKFEEYYPTWKKIDDITRIKNLGDYLIRLSPNDKSVENSDRNDQYKKRAIFYAIAQQTVVGHLGLMFAKPPKLEVPTTLEYLEDNSDGAGNSIYQQAQGVADDVDRFSRAALVVSYPRTEGPVSRQEIQEGRMVATIQRLPPTSVINWRMTQIGAKVVLSLVVIYEQDEQIGDDGYSVKNVPQIREMYLDEGMIYRERIWQKDKDDEWVASDEYTPTDAQGSTWNEIPFTFVGSENNDPAVDSPNMWPLVELNIGHYRNSADFEDNVWYCGQAQPWMSGITQSHLDLMKANNMYVGSRNVLGVPSGESFGIEAAPENPLVKQAMMDKVDLMIQLGARMIQPGSAAKTAELSAGEREVQHSTLSLIAANISDAYTKALGWVGKYMGTTDEAYFTINQDFVDPKADAQELQAIMAGVIQGNMPIGDYVRYMKRRNLFDPEKPDEEYLEEIDTSGVSPLGFE